MNYRLSQEAEEDLIRLYRYGFYRFGETQADRYIDSLYSCFDRIAENNFHLLKGFAKVIAFVSVVQIPFISN